jgi:hypothetical protein
MAEGSIIMKITVDTKHFQKQLRRTFTLRYRIALLLIDLAEKIGRIKLNYSIEQETRKK